MSVRLVTPDDIFVIPPAVAVCPYCQHALTATVEACEQEADGWRASEITVDCGTEPDMETDVQGWRWWMEQHTQMPSVFLLPVQQRVLQWFRQQYRFAIADPPPWPAPWG